MSRQLLFTFLLLSLFTTQSNAQNLQKHEVLHFLDSAFTSGVDEKTFPGVVVSFVDADTTWSRGYGNREWGSGDLITSDTRFQLGSVGKVLTAIAVLQQVEAGVLDLDADIARYLPIEISQLIEYPVTLRHLLTHSAGMNDKNIGYLSRTIAETESLKAHLQSNLPSFHQSPGIEINYSNYSYALAGLIVEEMTQQPFEKYVKQHIFDPLGMENSFIGFDESYLLNKQYAVGHSKSDDGFSPGEEFPREALPAGSLISTGKDMIKFMQAILRKDSLILGHTMDLLFGRSMSNHERLPGYSLGFEEQIYNGDTYWAKGGMLNGFLSQLVFFPDGSGLFLSQNSTDDAFLERLHSSLRNELMGSPVKANGQKPFEPSLYIGEYRNARYNRDEVESLISLFRGAFTIWEGNGQLQVYHNGAFHAYNHLGNHVFANAANADEKIVFVLDSEGDVIRMYRNINIGGLYVPTTYEKTKWYNSPSFVNEKYGFVLVTILLYSCCILGVSMIWLIRKYKPEFWRWLFLPSSYYWMALLGILLIILHIWGEALPLVRNTSEFLFGYPDRYMNFSWLAYGIVLIAALQLILMIKAWSGPASLFSKTAYTIFVCAFCVHCWFLFYWNFI